LETRNYGLRGERGGVKGKKEGGVRVKEEGLGNSITAGANTMKACVAPLGGKSRKRVKRRGEEKGWGMPSKSRLIEQFFPGATTDIRTLNYPALFCNQKEGKRRKPIRLPGSWESTGVP